MTCKRGDVALALFPDSNLRTAKPRPVLVVQADNLSTSLPQVVVAMITSNMARAGHPSRVTITLATPEGRGTGLVTDSVIMTDTCAPSWRPTSTACAAPGPTWPRSMPPCVTPSTFDFDRFPVRVIVGGRRAGQSVGPHGIRQCTKTGGTPTSLPE